MLFGYNVTFRYDYISEQICKNDDTWTDYHGSKCRRWGSTENRYCTVNPHTGVGKGTKSNYYTGIDIKEACCHCGGGKRPGIGITHTVLCNRFIVLLYTILELNYKLYLIFHIYF